MIFEENQAQKTRRIAFDTKFEKSKQDIYKVSMMTLNNCTNIMGKLSEKNYQDI